MTGSLSVPNVGLGDIELYGQDECRAEGFPHLSPMEFVAMFCATHKVPDKRAWGLLPMRRRQAFPMLPCDEVTRIEFEYVDQDSDEERCINCGEPADPVFTTSDDVDLCEQCFKEVPVERNLRPVQQLKAEGRSDD